jgi:hypothetical protein
MMAIQKFTVRVCDICRKPDDVLRCRLSIEGQRGRHADLCGSCRKPVDRTIERIDANRPTIVRVAELPMVTEADLAKSSRRRPTFTAAPVVPTDS